MKNKKFPKWLHLFPVLLLALILAVVPMSMAVPVSASSDVLAEGLPYPVFDGYQLIYGSSMPNPDPDSDELQLAFYLVDSYDFFGRDCLLYIDQFSGLGPTYAYVVDDPFNQLNILYPNIERPGTIVGNMYELSYEISETDEGLYVFFSLTGNELPTSDWQSTFPTSDSGIVIWSPSVDVNRAPPAFDGYLPLYAEATSYTSPGLLSVFSGVLSWLPAFILGFTNVFIVDGALSFLGILAVASLALAVILLLIFCISSWFKFH